MPIDLPVSATTWQLAKTARHGDTAEKIDIGLTRGVFNIQKQTLNTKLEDKEMSMQSKLKASISWLMVQTC